MYDSSPEDNCDSLLRKPCFQIDPTVELKETPANGEEYLLKVKVERKRCAAVTRCNKDISKFAKRQSVFANEPIPLTSVVDSLKPTIEWQNHQVADFSELRLYISRLQANKAKWPPTVKAIVVRRNDHKTWKMLFHSRSPTLSCIFGLPQSMLDNGLEIITKSLKDVAPGSSIDHKRGQWIYAMLACIQTPLLSETLSTLRTLARVCGEIRSRLEPEDENITRAVAPLNIFICIVVRYFKQLDLAD